MKLNKLDIEIHERFLHPADLGCNNLIGHGIITINVYETFCELKSVAPSVDIVMRDELISLSP